ncbi:TetR/AcrR family transcriptional regulator [Nocardiopsis gilva YIM 90087]|uniref:TetR/AcrR family transcriptional regulator n=1 Tax=Nocardiopsis gilva YIM 90087 TaxID=1235441 RepID=A0A223S789_9ACTN|nr:TetR/AcrR family transcriptional regulator [Nocardiopsis gilva]ASU83990.1 TetR/AcrR family transcriptional regulator [Nocardiopsis gilva YIM 90087]
MRSEVGQGGQHERSFIEKARRAQIIESAVAVIAEVGFAKASLARIAQHAGISKGVISYHFAGKDELMEQVVEQTYHAVADDVVPRIMAASTATDMLRTHILSVAEYMRGHRAHLRALSEIFVNFRTADGSPRYGIAASEEIFKGLEDLFRGGQAKGEFREFDTRVMAVSLQASIDSMFAYWVTYPDHDLEAHARELADIFDHATRAQQPVD